MKFINKEKDNILSIVKTLRPINYLYSKQNKDYEKFFGTSTLKGLIRQIKNEPKYNELLKPGESLEQLTNNKNKIITDFSCKGAFNYLEELTNLKSLPLVLLNKNKNQKRNRYSISENEDISTQHKREKERNKAKLQQQLKDSNLDADFTLDPGRYHPNYNYIKRRYPCAYLGKPQSKEKEDNFIKNKNNNNNNNNYKEEKKRDNNNNIKTSNNKSNNLGGSLSNETITTTHLRTKKNKHKIDHNSSNNYSMPKSLMSTNHKKNSKKKLKVKINSSSKSKRSNIFKLKEPNTISSLSHTIDLEKPKKKVEKYKILNDKIKFFNNCNSTSNINRNKKKIKLYRKASADNLRCPIVFDRMPGRDRPINFVDTIWNGCRTNYNPDYNIIRPHIPSTIFKKKRIYQNFKKYITGKIIRNYCFNPEQYFVFEIKKNKEKELTGKYGTIILQS